MLIFPCTLSAPPVCIYAWVIRWALKGGAGIDGGMHIKGMFTFPKDLLLEAERQI